MTAVGVNKNKQAIWAECEEQGLAYCKAKAELSFGARRQTLLDWISVAETQLKAREQAISQALARQQAEEITLARQQSSQRVRGLAMGAVVLVAIALLMYFNAGDLLQ